jgi:hypothetical protein
MASLLLVSVLQNKEDTFLGGGTQVLDKVRANIVGTVDFSFHAVGDGNTASRGSNKVSLVDDGIAKGSFKVLELPACDNVSLQVKGFKTALVVIRVSTVVASDALWLKTALVVIRMTAVVAGDAGDTLGRVVEHARELTVTSTDTSGGMLHHELLEGVTIQAHVVSIHVGDGLDFLVGKPHHVGGGRDLAEVLW